MLRAWSAAGGVTRTTDCELRPDRVKLARGAERGKRLHPGASHPDGLGCSERGLGFTPLPAQPGSLCLLPCKPSPGICPPPPPRVTFLLPQKWGSVPRWVSQRRERPLAVPHPAGTPRPPQGTDSRVLFQFYSKRAPAGRRQLGAVALPASVTAAGLCLCHRGQDLSPRPGFVTSAVPPCLHDSPVAAAEQGFVTCGMCWCHLDLGLQG